MDAKSEINQIVKESEWGFFRKKTRPAAAPLPQRTSSSPQPTINVPAKAISATNDPLPKFDRSKYQSAYDFWGTIAPEILKRQLGVKELDKKYTDAFDSLRKVPVSYHNFDDKRTKGSYNFGKRRIWLSPNATANDLAHELRHAFASRIPYSKKGTGILDKIYRFMGVDVKPEEPGYADKNWKHELYATHLQHQFRVYENLRKRLGVAPTSQQFFEEIDKIPKLDIINKRWRSVNGYQDKTDKAYTSDVNQRIEMHDMYRNALKDLLVRLDGPTGGDSWQQWTRA